MAGWLGVTFSSLILPLSVTTYAATRFGIKRYLEQAYLLKQINQLKYELVHEKILAIENSNQIEIDFVFNPKSALNKPGKIIVAPISLSDTIFKNLSKAFNTPRESLEKPILTTINISNAEMTDEQFNDLLSVGMGKFNTVRLVLSGNELSDQSISFLEAYVKNSKLSFKTLKTLDLSDNDLTGKCLEDLTGIVKYLNIEELDLSGNQSLSNEPEKLSVFISNIKSHMPSLKKLNLRNTGLLPDHIEKIGLILDGVSQLESLDVSENEALGVSQVVINLVKKLKYNISLTELKTDHNAILPKLSKILNEHDAIRSEIISSEKASDSITVQILNKMLAEQALPTSHPKFLGPNQSKAIEMRNMVDEISVARMTKLGVSKDKKIPIAEAEFNGYMTGELTQLYEKIKAGKALEAVHSELRVAPEPLNTDTATPRPNM
jgi:hypothetical protein